MTHPNGPRIFGMCACLIAAGCSQGNPLDKRVQSADYVSFAIWEEKVESDLAPDQVADLKQALQEARFHIMAEDTAHGSEAVEAALMDSLNGQTLREVILKGLGWELDRAEAERARLEDSLKKNAQMTTKPGDSDSANYLSDLRERQTNRLEAATEEVNRTRARITAETPLKGP
jgi:hypothetical protein